MAEEVETLSEGSAAIPKDSTEPSNSDESSEDNTDEKVVLEAKDRLSACESWEAIARERWLDDLKFANGDAYNMYQWPNEVRRSREIDELPCLTTNKTRQHNLQIINEGKQNKPSIKIRATGGGSTVESAKILNALIRDIEYKSNAQSAYDTASEYQVNAGLGYFRIETDYEDPMSFNQMPFIRRIWDPLTVYLDKDAKEVDKSDSRYGFVFEDLDEKLFKKKWPQYADIATSQTLDMSYGWKTDKYVRLAEYYRKVEKKDILYAVPGPQGVATFLKSELMAAPGLVEKIEALPNVRSRETTKETIEYYTIVGSTIVDRGIWPGKYIPIIPVIGEEIIIDGIMDRRGHTRALLDPQRIYNYMSSIAVEYSGLQSKSPYIAPAEAIEGLETYWENANRVNYSVLPYNGKSDDGNDIPPPKRQEPPVPMPAAIAGMQQASQEMMMASGQFEAEFGQKSNERSAKALDQREAASSTSTFHFVDHLAIAIRFAGVQLLDLIPKLYDSQRIMNILAEDGTSYEVIVDPGAKEAAEIRTAVDNNAAQQVLFNPNVGKYDVYADVGPNWGSRRQETFHALSLILTQAPQLTSVIGDLLLKSSDFDLADEAAARLRRLVPAEALGMGPSQNEKMLKAQLEQMGQLLKQTMNDLALEKIKVKGKDALRQVDAFRAYTERLKAVADAAEKAGRAISPEELSALADQVVEESLDFNLDSVVEASEPALKAAGATNDEPEEPPVAGARKAPDGSWYVQDRNGSYAKVE